MSWLEIFTARSARGAEDAEGFFYFHFLVRGQKVKNNSPSGQRVTTCKQRNSFIDGSYFIFNGLLFYVCRPSCPPVFLADQRQT
jgi:hypothetical protein